MSFITNKYFSSLMIIKILLFYKINIRRWVIAFRVFLTDDDNIKMIINCVKQSSFCYKPPQLSEICNPTRFRFIYFIIINCLSIWSNIYNNDWPLSHRTLMQMKRTTGETKLSNCGSYSSIHSRLCFATVNYNSTLSERNKCNFMYLWIFIDC